MRRAVQAGVGASLFVHCCLITALLGSVYDPGAYDSWDGNDTPHMIRVAAGFSDRIDESRVGAVRVAETPSQVTGDLVNAKIHSIVAGVQEAPSSTQLDRLVQAGKRLNQVSSDQSVDELADKFQEWLGYESRASEPRPDSASDLSDDPLFDHQTAQLHDVLRDTSGGPRAAYTAVLLDAEGRTMRIALSESDGEAVYELMQRIKANPLLDRIYRRIAMPLLDKFIKAGQAAEQLKVDAATHADDQETTSPPSDELLNR